MEDRARCSLMRKQMSTSQPQNASSSRPASPTRLPLTTARRLLSLRIRAPSPRADALAAPMIPRLSLPRGAPCTRRPSPRRTMLDLRRGPNPRLGCAVLLPQVRCLDSSPTRAHRTIATASSVLPPNVWGRLLATWALSSSPRPVTTTMIARCFSLLPPAQEQARVRRKSSRRDEAVASCA